MARKRADGASDRKAPAEATHDTSEFEREFVIDSFHPLTEADRARWESVKAKGEQSNGGSTSPAIAVRLDPGLLARSEALAQRMGISRDSLIARGLRAVLAAEGEL
jgi:hypothetical protein